MKLTADQLRDKYLTFFESKGHAVISGASLIPENDPTVLFTTAGMHPLVPYLLGEPHPAGRRLTNVQKCVRTLDIDEVGKTTRHGTFFQMNGNFSFGDYFKEGAIAQAWELVTSPQSEGGYGMDGDRLWATVYEDDDEAIALWLELTDIPAERLVRRGKKDNYWHMGVPGPGGIDHLDVRRVLQPAARPAYPTGAVTAVGDHDVVDRREHGRRAPKGVGLRGVGQQQVDALDPAQEGAGSDAGQQRGRLGVDRGRPPEGTGLGQCRQARSA